MAGVKIKRLIGFITAAVMSVAAISVGAVNAENSAQKLYTLKELNNMSNDDFMKLDGAEDIYNNIVNVVKEEQAFYDELENDEGEKPEVKLNGEFRKVISLPSDDYKANITENQITELLSDSDMEAKIQSPIYCTDEFLYDNYYVITFTDFVNAEPTEENIISFAKCGYCVNQVIELPYLSTYSTPEINSGDKVISGDVTCDRNIDIYDVIWIASDLSGIFEFTDAQKTVGDVNDDGECDLYDAIEIAKGLM